MVAKQLMFKVSKTCWLCFGLTLLACVSLEAKGQQGVTPAPPLGASNSGVLVDLAGTPVYGAANLKPTTWLGLNILHGNFAVLPQRGVRSAIGTVAVVPTAESGVFLFLTDLGIHGVLRSRPGGLVWEDAGGKSGKYVPL